MCGLCTNIWYFASKEIEIKNSNFRVNHEIISVHCILFWEFEKKLSVLVLQYVLAVSNHAFIGYIFGFSSFIQIRIEGWIGKQLWIDILQAKKLKLTLQEAASGMHPEWQGGQILPPPIKTSLEAILTQFFYITLIGGQK